ncbi:unnamed protein product, partial [Aphanomyces euteiches]
MPPDQHAKRRAVKSAVYSVSTTGALHVVPLKPSEPVAHAKFDAVAASKVHLKPSTLHPVSV